jgi:hypothetical protein
LFHAYNAFSLLQLQHLLLIVISFAFHCIRFTQLWMIALTSLLNKSRRSQPILPKKRSEALTAILEKARLKDERPVVQPIPLGPPPNFEPPVGDLGTAAPPHNNFSSNVAAASNVDPDGYDYGGRYGGY